MTDFENNSGMNHTNEGGVPENGASNTDTGSGVQNVNGMQNPYAYQNGYYRNTVPHQDEPVGARQDSGSKQVPPFSGNGYSYVNYYSTPNGSASGGSKDNNPKKKHTGLKVAACILAMVVVSGASIGIYEGVSSSLETRESIIAESNQKQKPQKSESSTEENSAVKKDSSNADSWIQLAATEGAMSVSDIVEKVTPSVVGVQAKFQMETSGDGYYGDFFGFGFGNQNSGSGTKEAVGVGTGIVMSEDGYIVTNAHVIYDDENGYGEAKAVQVQMYDEETTYDARIVAYDQEADIAVLQISADDLTPAEFGDSSTCKVGEMVVAIGNPLGLEFQNTVTCGIISALNRQVTINDNTMTLIQTDTAINSGNSGGPLINSAGQVIGINSAKMSSSYSSGASVEGIGFAIPMTEAKSIIDDLINYGYVTGRPQLGISCQDVSEAVSQAYQIPVGAYIISVTEGGAADQAGLKPADVITGIQGETISTTEELNNIKGQYNAGDVVTLTVVRNGEKEPLQIDVTLEEVTRNEE